eukprot:6194977-Pleurochrysis_carterae.AAC.1
MFHYSKISSRSYLRSLATSTNGMLQLGSAQMMATLCGVVPRRSILCGVVMVMSTLQRSLAPFVHDGPFWVVTDDDDPFWGRSDEVDPFWGRH